MTNLEKWKKKLAEAKDGKDFFYQFEQMLKQMNDELWEKHCHQAIGDCEYANCEECEERWLDMEAGDENAKDD